MNLFDNWFYRHPLAQENSVTNALLALNSAQSPDCKAQDISPHKDDYSQELPQNDISMPSIKHEPMAPHNYGVLHPPTSNGFFPNPFDGYVHIYEILINCTIEIFIAILQLFFSFLVSLVKSKNMFSFTLRIFPLQLDYCIPITIKLLKCNSQLNSVWIDSV